MAFPWLLSIGFTTTFAALFSKVWRLNQVISNSMQMRRVAVKETDVILPFVVLMTANIAVLVAWTIVDPLQWIRTEPFLFQSHGYCQSENADRFLIPIGIINGIALILANIQGTCRLVFQVSFLFICLSNTYFFVFLSSFSCEECINRVLRIILYHVCNGVASSKPYNWSTSTNHR